MQIKAVADIINLSESMLAYAKQHAWQQLTETNEKRQLLIQNHLSDLSQLEQSDVLIDQLQRLLQINREIADLVSEVRSDTGQKINQLSAGQTMMKSYMGR